MGAPQPCDFLPRSIQLAAESIATLPKGRGIKPFVELYLDTSLRFIR